MKNSRNSSGLSSNTWNDDTNQQSQNENSEYTGFDSPVYDDKIITENVNVKKLPIIGRLKKTTQYVIAALGITISGGLLFGNIWYNHSNAIDLQVSKDAANELTFLMGQSQRSMNNFINYTPSNFAQIKTLYSIIDKDINHIANGNKINEASLASLTDYWFKIKQGLNGILSSQEAIIRTNKNISDLNNSLGGVITANLSILNNMSKEDSQANQKQVVYLSQIITILQRIDKNLTALKAPDTNYNAVVNQIWNDSKILPAAYNALLKGSGSLGELKSRQIKTQLSDSLAQFSAISPKIVDVVQTMNALNKNVENNNKIIAINGNGIVENVKTSLLNYERSLAIYKNLVWLFALLFIGFISLLMAINTKENEKNYLGLKQEKALINEDIMKIIEDLSIISQGNIGHKVRLSQGKLMSLSDSINSTITKISELIQETNAAINSINSINKEQYELSENTKNKIIDQKTKISEGVQYFVELSEMLQDSELVLKNAMKISEKSMNTISRGSEAIETSQKSFNTIHSRIEDAQERVDNLFHSTGEIYDIASNLINLSERMDVLAIHASVQAAKAGENGKGFNVIAEGVQDISALFGEHSKRIKALVDTTYSNIKATTQTIKMAGDEIDEGTRLTTIVDNSLANLNDQSTYLSESVKRIDEKRVKQKERYDKLTNILQNVFESNDEILKDNKETSAKSASIRKETAGLQKELSILNINNSQK